MSEELPLLEVRDLCIHAGGRRIVDRISFRLQRGKVLGLIGESGAGKSSIGLAGLAYGRGRCAISGGQILLDGEDLRAATPGRIRSVRGVRVAYVAQSAADAFDPVHRIGDQVIEAAVAQGVLSRQEAEARAIDLFQSLGLPEPRTFGRRFPHQVSGGQLQRAMTAMALSCKPDLVVFDEPTTALDVTTQLGLLAVIKAVIRDTHTAALYITHDLAVVAQLADDIMVLRNGETVEYGSVAQIINEPREAYTRQLVNVRSIRRRESEARSNAVALSVEGVTAAYSNGARVLENVSARVEKSRTLAVVGESGSGKSTLARAITGLLPPLEGRIDFMGAPLPANMKDRSRDQLRRIQMIYQMADVAMNPRHTLLEIVGRPLTFYFGLKRDALRSRVTELLRQVELDESHLERYPAELSGGQKQRACIARALAAEPDVMICDEITSALDPLMTDGILNLLRDIQERTGVAYVFITHDLAIVRAIADSIIVMHRGRVVRQGSRDTVLSPPFDDYTALLLSSVPEMRPGWLEEALASRTSTPSRILR